MKFQTKKALLAAISVALIAVMAIAGTFAYLQDTSGDVVNTFEANKVKVELAETTGEEYHIIPGTSETKDPKVTVNNTVDSYVFVKVTDTSDGAVTYEIAEGWTKLEEYSDVYYREVSADEEESNKTFNVLKDNQVSYPASLTNADMLDAEGNLRKDIKLTFMAYAIQKIKGTEESKNVEFSPKEAWEQIPVIVSVKTAEDFVQSVEDAAVNEVVQLEENIGIDTAIPQSSFGTTNIDLNEKTLTVNNNSTTVSEGNLLTLENGTIEVEGLGSAYSAISVKSGARLSVENVTMNVDGAALFPIGEDAEINVMNSMITSEKSYCVSTNAATSANYGVKINLKDSTLKAPTAVMVNIPCSLTMENCKVEADMHGVVVRGGTAVIKDCKIVNNSTDNWAVDYFDKREWGSGNMVNLAGITIGNKSANAYQYPSDVTLINTTVTSAIYPTVYMYGNADEQNGAVLTYDTASNIDEVTYGGGYVVVNGEVVKN